MNHGEGCLKLIPAVIGVICLLSFAFAIENCADLLRFDYATAAIIPILGEDVSPGGPVLAVRSLKDTAFYMGDNGYAEYFYISAQDQYNNGKQIMKVGEIFYRHQNETGANNTYFKRAKQDPVYVESGDAFKILYETDYSFSYAGNSYSAAVLTVTAPQPISFGRDYSVGNKIFFLTETLDANLPELSKGAIYLETKSGPLYVPGGGMRFVGSCIISCSDPDASDYYQNTSCKSTLVDGDDYCLSESDVNEFTCSAESICVPKQFSCPFGCLNGKCVSGEKAKCEDTDGLNIAQSGRTSGNYPNGSKFSFLDECQGDTKVVEYSCSTLNVLKKEVVECNGGSCQQGKCVPIPTVAQCSDTDNGRNYEASGTCSDSTGSYADACAEKSVVEYYCDAGYCKTIVSPCDSCASGACSKEAIVPQSNTGLFIAGIVAIAVLALFAKLFFVKK